MFHGNGNGDVIGVFRNIMLLSSDLSLEVRLEVNLAKKEKNKKMLKEWNIN